MLAMMYAPLRDIDGFSRIVLEGFAPQLPEADQEHLRDIRNNTQQMCKLVDERLAFAQLSRQREGSNRSKSLGPGTRTT